MMQPGTKLGIAAAQLAQQGQYKPFTSDGKPTVVNNIITQETQKEAAQQAQIAGQIQAERERKMAEAIRQMAAQQATQGQGIAGLPADVNMAEGGIVGYNGEERSDVELDVTQRIKQALSRLYAGIETDYMKRAGATPEMIAEKLGRSPFAVEGAPPASASPASAPPANAQPSSKPPYIPEVSDRRLDIPSGGIVSPGMADRKMGTQRVGGQGVAQTRPTQTAPGASASSASDQVGISQLTQPGWASYLQAALDANRAQVLPEKVTAQGAEDMRRAEMIRRGIDPDYYKVRQREIDALQASYAKEEADRSKLVEQRGLENLISFLTRSGGAGSLFGGLAQGARGMEPIIEKQRLSDQEFRRLTMERQKAISDSRAAIQQFREAQAIGDLKTQADSKKEYNEAINKQKAAEATLQAGVVAPLIQADTAALNRESQERIAKWNNATQRAVADARKEGKNPYDTVVDNVRAEFTEWAKNPLNATKTTAERNAEYQAIFQRHLQVAKQFGLNVPATSAAPSANFKYNPATGKIE